VEASRFASARGTARRASAKATHATSLVLARLRGERPSVSAADAHAQSTLTASQRLVSGLALPGASLGSFPPSDGCTRIGEEPKKNHGGETLENQVPPPLSRHFADGRVLHLRATCSRYLLGGSAAPTGATVDAVLAAPLTTGPTDNCMGPDFRSA